MIIFSKCRQLNQRNGQFVQNIGNLHLLISLISLWHFEKNIKTYEIIIKPYEIIIETYEKIIVIYEKIIEAFEIII